MTRYSKTHVLAALRDVRQEIEQTNDGLSSEQALLLVDICQALELDDTDSSFVIGQAFELVTRPVAFRLAERARMAA